MRQRALITGASEGIGAIYADRLAKRGHDLILVARNRAKLAQTAARLESETGVGIEILPADLTARTDLERVAERLQDASIVFVVNNAGVIAPGPLLGLDAAALEAMVALNVTAALRIAHAAVKNFAPHGAGTLVNISSVVALAPERLSGTYSGTKAFLLNLSQALQAELAGTGIRVQAVLPGATRTAIWSKGGIDVDTLPADRVMDVEDMVDAALRGLDLGETVTIPSLPDASDWDRLQEARLALGPRLSLRSPAPRYGLASDRAVLS